MFWDEKQLPPPPLPSPKNTMSPKQRTIIRHGESLTYWLSGAELAKFHLLGELGQFLQTSIFFHVFAMKKGLTWFVVVWGIFIGESTYITQLCKDDDFYK